MGTVIKLLLIGGLLYLFIKPAITVYFQRQVETTKESTDIFSPGSPISISPFCLLVQEAYDKMIDLQMDIGDMSAEEWAKYRQGLSPVNPVDEKDLWDE